MTYTEAAQSAIDCQNACNSSGLLKTLAGEVLDAIWTEAHMRGAGTRWVNSHPIIALYLHKVCEMSTHCSMSSLSASYEPALEACTRIASSDRSAY